jgi:hypothetical protein
VATVAIAIRFRIRFGVWVRNCVFIASEFMEDRKSCMYDGPRTSGHIYEAEGPVCDGPVSKKMHLEAQCT